MFPRPDMRRPRAISPRRQARQAGDRLWYKDGIFYELRVRSFFDSNGDGIGDFAGADLQAGLPAGPRCPRPTWMLPFYPSPLRDDGYDIADYTDVHPDCGTVADFEATAGAGASARHPRHHRAPSSTTPRIVTPGSRRAREAAPGISRARLLRLERDTPDQLSRRPHHLQGLREPRTGPGTPARAPTTGTASSRTSRTADASRTRPCTRRCSPSSTSG